MVGDLIDHHESISVRDWQWIQNDCVDKTEDRSVGANSQCECEHHDKRKSRILAQHAQ